MSNILLIKNRFLRWIVYVLLAIGLAIGLTYLLTINASKFEGARGFAVVGLFPVLLTVFVLALFVFDLFYRDGLSNQQLKRFHIITILFSAPGLLGGFFPLAYYYADNVWTTRVATAKENSERQLASAEQQHKVKLDLKRDMWRQLTPLCLEFEEKGVKNNCQESLVIKYCWQMESNRDWGVTHTDCSKNEYSWILAKQGFNAYENRPWCRSYGYCAAVEKTICAVKSTNLTTAKELCD